MPIYEYRCAECGHEFENIQRISEPDPSNCPACEAPDPGRLISRSAFHLRGGGWYSEGYGDSKAAPKKDSAASDKADLSTAEPASAPAKASSTPAAE